jgi:hypothetical protein
LNSFGARIKQAPFFDYYLRKCASSDGSKEHMNADLLAGESPGFSSANAGFFGANVLLASQSASGAIQSHRAGAEKGDSGL